MELALLIVEVIYMVITFWWLHGSKKKPDIYAGIYFILVFVLYVFIEKNYVPKTYINVVLLANVLLCVFEFGDKIREAVLYTVLNYLFLYIVQFLFAIAYMVFSPKGNLLHITIPLLTVMHILILIFTVFLQLRVPVGKYVKKFIHINYIGNIALIFAGIALIAVLLVQKSSFYFEDSYIISMAIGIALLALFFVKMYGEMKQNVAYKERLLLQEKYNRVYEELLQEIRHRQHDYNNHLQALFSMNMAYDDIDELKKHQMEYYNQINRHDDYDLLKESGSPVLAAFLYLKVQNAKERGIETVSKVDVDKLEQSSAFTDIIELVGNLFDNACEATMEAVCKRMTFSIIQRDTMLDIKTSNPYEWTQGERADWFFKDGVSTKGEKRGMGLTNVCGIVEKYHGTIDMAFDVEDGTKIVVFEIKMKLADERENAGLN